MSESRGLRILHVEDVEWDARVVKYALDEGLPGSCDLVWARSLADGIAAAGREAPDAILLDLNLPDATGLHTLDAMHAAYPRVPVVVLTGTDDEALGERALGAGAQDYLPKGAVMARTLSRSIRYAIERGRARERERELAERLARARRDAMQREGLAALGTLVMGVAHEVNNPLTYMTGSLELAAARIADARERAVPPEVDAELSLALADLRRVTKGIDRLAEISRALDRLREPRSLRDHAVVDLVDVVLAALDEGPWPERARERIRLEKSGTVPVEGSAEDLKWVVQTLVQNAVEATHEPGGTVAVRVGVDDGRAFVEVADTGQGIPSADAPRVFVPFFTTKPDRVGLSLARAYRVAQRHAGALTFHSGPDAGSVFRLELPARSA